MRDQFETYMKQTFRGVYLASVDGRYVNEYHQCAWLAWQASREAIEVELPEPVEIESIGVGCTFTTECYDISEVLEALRDQGLRVKPC